MKRKLFVSLFLIVGLAAFLISTAASQSNRQNRRDRFRHNGVIEDEDRSAIGDPRSDATEAPTGFDNLTNGFTEQGPDFEELNEDTVVALRSFNDNPPITRRAVGSATRTSSPEAPARWRSYDPGA